MQRDGCDRSDSIRIPTQDCEWRIRRAEIRSSIRLGARPTFRGIRRIVRPRARRRQRSAAPHPARGRASAASAESRTVWMGSMRAGGAGSRPSAGGRAAPRRMSRQRRGAPGTRSGDRPRPAAPSRDGHARRWSVETRPSSASTSGSLPGRTPPDERSSVAAGSRGATRGPRPGNGGVANARPRGGAPGTRVRHAFRRGVTCGAEIPCVRIDRASTGIQTGRRR